MDSAFPPWSIVRKRVDESTIQATNRANGYPAHRSSVHILYVCAICLMTLRFSHARNAASAFAGAFRTNANLQFCSHVMI